MRKKLTAMVLAFALLCGSVSAGVYAGESKMQTDGAQEIVQETQENRTEEDLQSADEKVQPLAADASAEEADEPAAESQPEETAPETAPAPQEIREGQETEPAPQEIREEQAAEPAPQEIREEQEAAPVYTAVQQKMQIVTAFVVWETDGSQTEASNRPKCVDLTLEYTTDGVTWNEWTDSPIRAVYPSASGWSGSWQLPDADENGAPITFRVRENELTLYKTTYKDPKTVTDAQGTRSTELTVTNTYQDAWNYNIDLSWDVEDPVRKYTQDDVCLDVNTRTLKYQLTVSTNDDYAAGDLSVRIPYMIWKNRNGIAVVPTGQQISVPKYPEKNSEYAFSYTIDTHGTEDVSDDEIVFTNQDPLETGFKQTLTVGYTVEPYFTIDLSETDLTATGFGLIREDGMTQPEILKSNTIRYRIDTGAKLSFFSKLSYPAPGLDGSDREGRLYSWNAELGTQPADFDPDNYNYVAYTLSAMIKGNQPYRLELQETPDHEGKIISVVQYYSVYSPSAKLTYDEESGLWKSETLERHYKKNDNTDDRIQYYVVAAYPKTEADEEQTVTYNNTAILNCYAADDHPEDKTEKDQNDLSSLSGEWPVEWKDYQFVYNGSLESDFKMMNGTQSAGITLLEKGIDTTADFRIVHEINGYDFENGYTFNLDDDAVYAYAQVDGAMTAPVRLGDGDYEIRGIHYSVGNVVMIYITYDDINRTTGVTEADPEKLPAEPFLIQGRRNGTWETILTYQMTEANANVSVSDELLAGKGYTALRVQSPKGVTGHYRVEANGRMRFFHTSSKLQEFFAQEGLTRIYFRNFAQYRIYRVNEDGSETWVNAQNTPNDSYAKDYGLAAEDLAAEGAYPVRKNDTANIGKVYRSAFIQKTTIEDGIKNDTVNSRADVPFEIVEAESLNATNLPTEVYEDFAQNDGTFYDLLPAGYTLNKEQEVRVQGYYYGYSSSIATVKDNAVLKSVETIDNYHGSGRQMVIFHVESTAEGGNYRRDGSSMYSGFKLRYTASISWADYNFFPSGYNLVVFQRGDEREMGGTAKDGSGSPAQGLTNVWGNAPDGTLLMKDVDGDGDTSKINNLYAYSYVSLKLFTTVQSGISKAVKGNSGYYRTDDVTDIGADYSYKIQVTTSDGGTTSDLVIIDVLENAANVDGATGETGWKGTFAGVSTLTPQRQGIDVKVYYAVDPTLTYNDEEKMKLDSGYWSETMPEDPADVKAVAFDLSKKTDGTDFIFDEKGSTFVEIFMKAPDQVPADAVYAYNRPAYRSKFQVTGGQVPQTVFNNGPRTTIALKQLQEFSFRKCAADHVSDTENLTPLSNVQFLLYRHPDADQDHGHNNIMPGTTNSCWGTTPVRRVYSGRDGMVSFEDLDSGTYAIIEGSVPTGIKQKKYCYWTFTVDAAAGTVSEPQLVTISQNAENSPMVKGDDDTYQLVNSRMLRKISVKKTWEDDAGMSIRPAVITFDLYQNGTLYRTGELDSSSRSEVWLFTDLPVYSRSGDIYAYEVREREVPGYEPVNGASRVQDNVAADRTAYYTNTRQGILDITKLVADGGETARSFSFRVALTDENGEALSAAEMPEAFVLHRYAAGSDSYTEETAAADENGILTVSAAHGERVRILDLPVGCHYTVTESEDPGYTSEVTAGAAEGDASSTEIGTVTFTNTRKTITISGTKTWEDEDDHDGIRPSEITVRLMAGDTEVDHKVVTADENGSWSYEFTDLPQYADGQEIVYTVTEDPVEGYETSMEGYDIVNRHTPETEPEPTEPETDPTKPAEPETDPTKPAEPETDPTKSETEPETTPESEPEKPQPRESVPETGAAEATPAGPVQPKGSGIFTGSTEDPWFYAILLVLSLGAAGVLLADRKKLK